MLVTPHPSIHDVGDQMKLRLLSSVFLVATCLAPLNALVVYRWLPDNNFYSVLVTGTCLLGYLFSRTTYYRVGIMLVVISLSGLTHLFVYGQLLQDDTARVSAFVWVTLPIILAIIYLPRWQFILIVIGNLLAVFNMGQLVTGNNRDILLETIVYVTIFSLLLSIITRHLQQIEQQRLAVVEGQKRELQQSNAQLYVEVQRRMQTELTLAEAHEALQAVHLELEERVRARTAELAMANRDLETMLYVTSHDLKEPLRSIQSFSSLVAKRYGARLDERGRDYVLRIERAAQRLRELIDDILTLSQVQRMKLPDESVNAVELVQSALDQLVDRIEATQATIIVADNLPDLTVNRTWAIRAIYNLISNALKYTRLGEPPQIVIDACPSGAGLVIRDRGVGLDPEHATRIFELFQRAVSRDIEGTGAGLTIVHEVATRHGGRVIAQPRDGGGAEFHITFRPIHECKKVDLHNEKATNQHIAS